MKCGYCPPYQSVRIETKVATPISGRQINQVLNWFKGLADILNLSFLEEKVEMKLRFVAN